VPGTPQWYDMTTDNSWLAHVARYADFGEGTEVFGDAGEDRRRGVVDVADGRAVEHH
jgi:hypothetical protein